MPPTNLVDPEKMKAVVSILIRAPQLTVREAMILAKFTEEEANTKSMQWKVSQDAQKKAATEAAARATISASELSPPIKSIDWDNDDSPHGVSSVREEEWMPKKHRLNAKQKQEKQKEVLQAKEKYTHKAATKLYSAKLDKGEKGMLSRKVEPVIEKKYKGVGPRWVWS
jgi:hypothetical protein